MEKNLEEMFKRHCLESGIVISKEKLDMFSEYMSFLIEYNKHTNLTSIIDPKDIVIKHFIDSVIINKFIKIEKIQNVIDIGTGAGFPGVPIKICFPNINLTLVDSLNKRIIFLEKLREKLNLEVELVHSRAEDLAKNPSYRGKFDLAVSRAVASLNALSEYCIPYLKKGGLFVAYKGSNVDEELSKCQNCFKILNSKIFGVEKLDLPEMGGTRNFIILEKLGNCDAKYPRPASKILKKPL